MWPQIQEEREMPTARSNVGGSQARARIGRILPGRTWRRRADEITHAWGVCPERGFGFRRWLDLYSGGLLRRIVKTPMNYLTLRRLGLLLIVAMLGGCQSANGVFEVRNFGASGDGKHLDTRAVNKAIDAAAKAGGGMVHFSSGTYLCYSIHLKSNVTLYLENGAMIRAAGTTDKGEYDPPETFAFADQYQDFGHTHWHNSLIWGENIYNVAILGPGTIDGKDALNRGSPKPKPTTMPATTQPTTQPWQDTTQPSDDTVEPWEVEVGPDDIEPGPVTEPEEACGMPAGVGTRRRYRRKFRRRIMPRCSRPRSRRPSRPPSRRPSRNIPTKRKYLAPASATRRFR